MPVGKWGFASVSSHLCNINKGFMFWIKDLLHIFLMAVYEQMKQRAT